MGRGSDSHSDVPVLISVPGKLSQTISFPSISLKRIGDSALTPTASATSGLALSFTSSDTTLAKIVGGQIRWVGVGSVTITASQAGDSNYLAATSVGQTVSIEKGNQTLTFAAPPAKTVGDADFDPGATASSGLAVSYTSSDTSVVKMVGSSMRVVGVGTSTVTASQAGNASYNPAASVSRTVTVSDSASPGPAIFGPHPDVRIQGGTDVLLIIREDGNLYSAGRNSLYHLAQGHTQEHRTFLAATTLGSWRHVAIGENGGMGIRSDSTLWAWGSGSGYTLGNDNTGILTAMTRIGSDKWISVAISKNSSRGMGIRADRTLWGWGNNENGSIGDGTTTTRTTPVQIGSSEWLEVSAGWAHTLAIRTDSTLWAWGLGTSGELGNGTTNSSHTPQQVGTDKWIRISAADRYSLGLKSDSTLWTWGGTHFFGLGHGNTLQQTLPKQVGTAKWRKIVTPLHQSTIALRADSTLWSWGSDNGTLGLGTGAGNQLSPSQVGSLKWRDVGCGQRNCAGLDASGQYWAWGTNTYGAVGDGTTTQRWEPVQIRVPGKVSQTITFPTLASRAFNAADFSPGATASSGLSVSYASSDTTVAKVVGGLIRVVGLGTATLTASQSGNDTYDSAANVSRDLTVTKISQTLTFGALAARTLGDADFDPGATASSGLTVSYASSDTLVAKVVGGLLRPLAAGSAVITASQAGNGSYEAAPSITQTLVVSKQTPSATTFTLGPDSLKTFGDAPFRLTGTSGSGLPLTFSSSDSTVAKVVGDSVFILKAGTVSLTASQAGNATYSAAADVSRSMSIAKANQTLTFNPLATRIAGNADFDPGATASSGLAVSYASSDTLVARVVGSLIRPVGAGTAVITASQSGNATYHAASPLTQSLTVSKAAPSTTTFSLGADSLKTLGDAPFRLTGTSASGLPLFYTSSDSTVAKVVGDSVYILKAGTVTLTASQPGNSAHEAAADVFRTLVIAKANQTLAFAAMEAKTFGDSAFALSATATSGLPVTFASSDPAVAAISGSTLTLVGAGTAEITASQAGNDSYTAANPVTRTLTVNKAGQAAPTFSLGDDTLKTLGDAPFRLTGTSGSGLPLTYTSSDSTVAKVVGDSVFLLKAGTVTLTASQPGGTNHLASPDVARTLRVRAAKPAPHALPELSPRETTALLDTTVALAWTRKEGATGYRVQATYDTAGSTVIVDTVLADTAFSLEGLAFGAEVRWRVAAVNEAGQADFPPYAGFKVRPAPPPALDVSRISTLPPDGVGTTVEIAFPKVEGATGYHVQVGLAVNGSRDSSQPLLLDTVVTAPVVSLTHLEPGREYVWRAAPVNGPSPAPFTPWLSFKVKDRDHGTVTRSGVVDSASSREVAISSLVALTPQDPGLSDVKITLTESKAAPPNLAPGFMPLTGRIDLDARVGSAEVKDNQLTLTLNPPDTALGGKPLLPEDFPQIYLIDSVTGELELVYDLPRDSAGRIILPLSKGKSFLLAVDTLPPVIKDSTPPVLHPPGARPTVVGVVEDNIKNSRGWLKFRRGGAHAFDSTAVTIDAEGRFELPLDFGLDSTGFEYHLVALDGRNRVATARTDMSVEVNPLQAPESLPHMQWRLFAPPTMAKDIRWAEVAAHLGAYKRDWKLFERGPDGLREFGPNLEKATPGTAYWLKTRSKNFLPSIPGGVAPMVSAPFEVVLPPGSWRSFGNPYLFPASWQSVLDSSTGAPGALVGPYTYRDTSWVAPVQIAALEPWEGYYAHNASADTLRLRIPSLKVRAQDSLPLLAQSGFHLEWVVKSPQGKEAGNLFGALPRQPAVLGKVATSPARHAGQAALWRAPKPESPEAPFRAGFHAGPEDPRLLQTDFRAWEGSGSVWTARIAGLKPGQRYANRLLGLERLPEGLVAAVADSVTGAFLPWTEGEAYVVEPVEGEESRDLRIYLGSPAYVAARGSEFAAAFPSALSLGIHPNPVRDFALVTYSIPAALSSSNAFGAGSRSVRLTLYDMQGRAVGRFANGKLGAGQHSYRLSARGNRDKPLAAGVYRLRLEVDGKSLTRTLHVLP